MMPRMIETLSALVPLAISSHEPLSVPDKTARPRSPAWRPTSRPEAQRAAGATSARTEPVARSLPATTSSRPSGQADRARRPRPAAAAAVLQQRREDDQGEEAVGHRGDRRQDLDDRLDHLAQRKGSTSLRQTAAATPSGTATSDRAQRHQAAADEDRQRAEFGRIAAGVPACAGEELLQPSQPEERHRVPGDEEKMMSRTAMSEVAAISKSTLLASMRPAAAGG